MTKQTCKERVKHGPSRGPTYLPCERTAKGQLRNGNPACGIHLNAERVRDKNRDQYIVEVESHKVNEDRAGIAGEILAELGIESRPQFLSREFFYTGKIVVDPQQLFNALGITAKLPPRVDKSGKPVGESE